jgi:hypothetical protein
MAEKKVKRVAKSKPGETRTDAPSPVTNTPTLETFVKAKMVMEKHAVPAEDVELGPVTDAELEGARVELGKTHHIDVKESMELTESQPAMEISSFRFEPAPSTTSSASDTVIHTAEFVATLHKYKAEPVDTTPPEEELEGFPLGAVESVAAYFGSLPASKVVCLELLGRLRAKGYIA